MRILLTGSNGQVGRALHAPLQSLGTVVVPERTAFDFRYPHRLAPMLDELAPDLIVNPAAYTAVDRAEDEAELAFLINAEAPKAIARWAAENSVPMLHFSTDYVFDGSGQTPWREEDRARPLSVYGASKLYGETAVRESGGAHLVVRTSWVFSASGASFLRTIVRLAKEQSELRIVSDQFGAPTSARSIAQAVVSILAGTAGPAGTIVRADVAQRFGRTDGLLHLSNSGETSWHGFACAIVEGLRAQDVPLSVGNITPIATADYPAKARRPLNSRLDMTRLVRQFGIQTPTWRAALSEELADLAHP